MKGWSAGDCQQSVVELHNLSISSLPWLTHQLDGEAGAPAFKLTIVEQAKTGDSSQDDRSGEGTFATEGSDSTELIMVLNKACRMLLVPGISS